MNFLNAKTSWSNKELGLLKICIGSVYVLVGAYFHDFFMRNYAIFLAIFGVTVVWSVYLWIKKSKAPHTP